MIRRKVLLLAIVMVLQCFLPVMAYGEDTTAADLKKAFDLGIYPQEDLSNLDDDVTERHLYELLGKSITIVSGAKNAVWTEKTQKAGSAPVERQMAAQIIVTAAKEYMGIKRTFATPKRYSALYLFRDEADKKYGELNTDYMNLVFVSGLYDVDTKLRVMECTPSGYFRYSDKMTVREAIQAAYRLTKLPPFMSATEIAGKPPVYVALDKIGAFDRKIITDELLKKQSKLPEASSSSIPFWTGFVMENKKSANLKDNRWNGITDGSNYFYKQQIKFIAERGFNSARVCYSLSFLSKPGDIMQINESELRQLDELISWGLAYDVHIMVSITGLPGKVSATVVKGVESSDRTENVKITDELFKDPKMSEVYGKYMKMLAKRYAAIPNRNLSFELLSEPLVPNGDLALYEKVLTPVVKSMWEASPKRIIVVDDVNKQVPEGMAKLGCCLSLHNSTYTVDTKTLPGISYTPSWPMEYLPAYFTSSGQVLRLNSIGAYKEGTLSMYIDNSRPTKNTLVIKADGKVIFEKIPTQSGWLTAQIPSGARKLEIGIKESTGLLTHRGIKIEQQGETPVTIVVHDLYSGKYDSEMPTIRIDRDGKIKNLDQPQKVVDSDYIRREYLQKFMDAAKKYNVGFIMTGINGPVESMSEAENMEYEADWIFAAKSRRIPWIWDSLENVFAPAERLYPEKLVHDTVRYDVTPLYEYKPYVDFLKKYQK